VTWRVLAYPLGFYLPFAAIPLLGPLGALFVGLVLMPIGLSRAQEVGASRSLLVCIVVAILLGVPFYFLFYA
jgi:hypothetical protein